MKSMKLLYTLAIPVVFMLSCKKFLDIKPKGVIIAETVNDYEGILNADGIVNPFGLNVPVIYPTDDLTDQSFSTQSLTSPKGNLYFWVEYINNSTVRPDLWADMYNRIANLNVVTEGVLSATDGTPQQKKQLYAEAVTDKVFNYFHLLSFFSPAFDPTTAGANYGVPYITSTDVSQSLPVRPSLQVSYTSMINDLTSVLGDLPVSNINNTRATKNVAYGMLTRIYMSMGDYTNALKYANLVLNSGKAVLLDYNDYIGTSLPATNSSPEELWVRYGANLTFRYSNELLSKYDLDTDLRIKFLATKKEDGSYNYGSLQSYNPNRGLTYAEIYLDKAECLARAGDIEGALEIVNEDIRTKRFAPDNYVPLEASTKEEAITAVLLERRRELAFKGLRWSDMKRLDKEGRMPAVQRIGKDGVTVLSTLKPGSSNYTFQIPLAVQSFNSTMPLNKR